eukprot:COSAG06_NODE_7670_length_2419_cov_2.534914_5_plen_68_part_00
MARAERDKHNVDGTCALSGLAATAEEDQLPLRCAVWLLYGRNWYGNMMWRVEGQREGGGSGGDDDSD